MLPFLTLKKSVCLFVTSHKIIDLQSSRSWQNKQKTLGLICIILWDCRRLNMPSSSSDIPQWSFKGRSTHFFFLSDRMFDPSDKNISILFIDIFSTVSITAMKCILCEVRHSLHYCYPVTCPSMLLLRASLIMPPYSNSFSSSWLWCVSNSTSFTMKDLSLCNWPCIKSSTGESFHNSIEMKIKRMKIL